MILDSLQSFTDPEVLLIPSVYLRAADLHSGDLRDFSGAGRQEDSDSA